MFDSKFAEIEIQPAVNHSASTKEPLRYESPRSARERLAFAPLPIAPRERDPIRELFFEMRGLASKRPFPKSDSELFYRQARFMEDFTDDYDGYAEFNMYYPYYQRMGYDYLRTYFTWRTKARSGDLQPASLSYIFLYIYELLSGIGVENPAASLEKLVDIWQAFSKEHRAIESYMPKWFKEFHVFYELPHSFSDFVEKHGLQRHYSLTLLLTVQAAEQDSPSASPALQVWNSLSSYDVTKSRFYAESKENAALLSKCFDSVLCAVQAFCTERDVSLADLLVYCVGRRTPWQPFRDALFGSRARQTDREVHISKYERYYCKNGEWTASLPVYYSSQKDFIGYIIKKTEACLREATKYKYKLAVEMKPGGKPFRELQRLAAKRAELDKVIEKAAAGFWQDYNRTIVTVDHASLERIREEALETQGQLIVEDEPAQPVAIAETLESQGQPIAGGERAAPGDSAKPLTDTVGSKEKLTLSFSDGWKALKKALTETERKALEIILEATQDIKTFADDNGIMLEVLIDSINEKASNCIGDSIMELDGEVYVFDEYKGNIEGMLNLSRGRFS